MIKIGERAERLDKLSKRREELVEEAKAYVAALKKREKKLLAEHAKLAAPKNLTALRVVWVMDGKEVEIGPTGDLSPGDFIKHVEAIPRSVKQLMDGGRLRRLEQIKGDLRALPREYKKTRQRIETDIYRTDAQIAKYEERTA